MDINENTNFDKTAWAEKKKALREEVFSKVDEYLDQLPADPEAFQKYLNVQGRFPQCSVSNAILIADQMPNATEYHTFEDWKKKGVSIMKGELGFNMLIPNGNYTGKDGLTRTRFDVQKVFDVAQTNAVINPNQENLQLVLKAMLYRPVVPIEVVNQLDKGAAFLPEENRITIGRGMTVIEGTQNLSMALAHGELSKMLQDYEPGLEKNSFYARCASYMVCRYYGVDPTNYNFLDVQKHLGGISGKDLRSQLETIRSAARTLIDRIEKGIKAIQDQERSQTEQERGGR